MDDDTEQLGAAIRRRDEAYAGYVRALGELYALMRALNSRDVDPWPPKRLQDATGLSRETIRRKGIQDLRRIRTDGANPTPTAPAATGAAP